MVGSVLGQLKQFGLAYEDGGVLGPLLVSAAGVAATAPSAAGATAPPPAVTTLTGAAIPGVVSGLTDHVWVAGTDGLFHTSPDLAAEWKQAYAAMLAGNGSKLTAIQRLEGNAEAIFENTGIVQASAAKQAAWREDLQRQFDAVGAAMKINQAVYGTDPSAPLTGKSYVQLGQTLRSSPVLSELGTQGHGLNKPPAARYAGYTTDFQNRVDGQTLYVGGGGDNGEKAVADLLDDVVLSHLPFATVMRNGTDIQLNQNGADEDTLQTVVNDTNDAMFNRVFVASDFSPNRAATGAVVTNPGLSAPAVAAVVAGPGHTLDGTALPPSISGLTPHDWTLSADGTYVTSADLGAEWKSMLARFASGGGAGMTAVQRLEAQAEVVVEATGVGSLAAGRLAAFRMDAQREFDAIGAAMELDRRAFGTDPSARFTAATWAETENTLQSSETLKELAIQGHGLNSPPAPEYRGFTSDFQNRVDNATLYVGPGAGPGQKAIADFFDDVILSHAPFPTTMRNGVLEQTNQNGQADGTFAQAVASANQAMFGPLLTSADFRAAAPVLREQEADQSLKSGKAFSFRLPAGSFTDPAHGTVRLAASQSDGTRLPSWLSFDAKSGTFSGVSPVQAGTVAVKVVATTSEGGSGSETFSVVTAAPLPLPGGTGFRLAVQAPDQEVAAGKPFAFRLPPGSFTGGGAAAAPVLAARAGSGLLPSWLAFDAKSGTFSGTAPSTAATVSVGVVATSAAGSHASEAFRLLVAA